MYQIYVLAVQRLFENRIFGCSRGDFTEAGEYVIIRSKDKTDFETRTIQCYCQGLDIPGLLVFYQKQQRVHLYLLFFQ